MQEPIQKVFSYGKSAVAVGCQECGRVKKLKATHLGEIHHIARVKCSCGARFHVFFEKRVSYRKMAHLEGRYAIKPDPDAWLCLLVVENLSRTGIGFKTIGRYDINEGDTLSVQFTLDNADRTTIKSNVVVRSVNGQYIGAEFCSLDDHTKKELGFYLMP